MWIGQFLMDRSFFIGTEKFIGEISIGELYELARDLARFIDFERICN